MGKLKEIKTQDGDVCFFCEKGHEVACDINVKPGVKTLTISRDMSMADSRKSFADVEKLYISEGVRLIDIPNTLFPNVKYVTSYSRRFCDGKYLLADSGLTLHNTFCRREDEVIDLKNVMEIKRNAFKGCKSTKIINTDEVMECGYDAFAESGFMEQPFVDGIKRAGTIVIAVDESLDEIDLHDDRKPITLFHVDISNIKRMVTHRTRGATFSTDMKSYPKEIIVDASDNVSEYTVISLMHVHNCKLSSACPGIIHLTPRTEKALEVKEIDGVVYSSDMKTLIACSTGVKHIKIPDSVKIIRRSAFSGCNIESIDIPDSVEEIGKYVFSDCQNLHSVKFGKGIKMIPGCAFKNCRSLEYIDIPEQVTSIYENAFYDSGLKRITLHEGLQSISSSAFHYTPMEEIEIPASVKKLGYCFGNNIRSVTLKKFIPNVSDKMVHYGSRQSRVKTSMVQKIKCDGKEVFFPRSVPVSSRSDLKSRINQFFEDGNTDSYCSTFDCCHTACSKRHFAALEYEKYKNWEAKEYLKKNARTIAYELLEEDDENVMVEFLKLGFVSRVTLKKLLEEAGEKNKMVIKAYIMQLLEGNRPKNEKSKFYL